jgi:GNAT superfamily N-acetyltransferase
MTAPTVRIASSADAPQIEQLLHLMHAEGGLLSLDLDAAREMFALAFNRKGGLIGVIGDPIEAAIGLLITRFWYTRENHLEEYFNFVHPDYRRSAHAKTLISFAKRCSDEIKIPLVIGVMTNKRVVPKVRFYRQILGNPAGAFFVYGGNWVNGLAPENDEFWEAAFPPRGSRGMRDKVRPNNGTSNGTLPLPLTAKEA